MSEIRKRERIREASGLLSFNILRFLGRLGLTTLRGKVFVIGIVTVGVALSLVSAVAYWSFYSTIDSGGQLRQAALSGARAVDVQILENIEFAKSIADDPLVVQRAERAADADEAQGINGIPGPAQNAALEEKYKDTQILSPDKSVTDFLLEKERIKPVFQQISFTDRYGLNVGASTRVDDVVQSDEEWWQRAMQSGLYVSDVGFDKAAKSWVLDICVAIPNQQSGRPNGVLRVKYNLTDIQDYVSAFKQYQSGQSYVVTKAGLYLLHDDSSKRDQEIDPSLKAAGLLSESASKDQGMLEYRLAGGDNAGNEDRVVSFARSKGFSRNGSSFPGLGWTFVVDNSRDAVYGPAHKMLWRIVLAALVVFLVLAMLAYLFSSGISGAVTKLSDATERVRAGNLSARVDLDTGDELQRVAEGFNQMLERLGEMVRTEIEQRQSLSIISKAVESSSDAIAIRDRVRKTTYYNQTFKDLTGYNEIELPDIERASALYKDPQISRIVTDSLNSGNSWRGEVDILTKDGEPIIVSLRANAIKDESGNIIGRIGIYTDITKRKTVEYALKRSEEQYRMLFDGNPHPMWVYDAETNQFLAVNEAAIQHYGYSQDEFLAMKVSEISTESGGAGTVHQATNNGFARHKRKDESVIDVEINSHALEFGDRQARLVLANDVTERRLMEEAIKKSELEYRNLFESANDPMLLVDPGTGKVIELNARAQETYGYSPDDVSGLTFEKLYKEGTDARNILKEAMIGGVRNFETTQLRKDGAEIHVLGSFSAVDHGGKRVVLAISRDITDRKQAEQVLEKSLNDFLSLVSSVSEGDLTQRGAELVGPLQTVFTSINKMLDKFGLMLTRVKQIGLSVTSSATEILAASEQIAAGAQRQADEITNTSSAVEEMAASMNQVSRNAEASAEAARRALGMAQHGDASVRDTSDAMARIDTAVQVTAEKMRTLARRSSEISEIIDLINDVAAQTNLLSLNAAIEAAHAGEAGLGFSVVAEEIRKLAERSARATRDVGNLIKAIQTETSEALSAMENGMREVQAGASLAEQARKSLLEISGVVRQSAELIEEISAASEEQARVTRNLAGAMQTVSSITLETSAGAHETAQTIQGMVGLSEHLNEAISQFRVAQNFVHPFSYDGSGAAGGNAAYGLPNGGD